MYRRRIAIYIQRVTDSPFLSAVLKYVYTKGNPNPFSGFAIGLTQI